MPLKRGRCYIIVVKLAEGARFSAGARDRNIGIEVDLPDSSISAGPGVIGPGAAADIGCPQETVNGVFSMSAYGGESLGTGPFTIELYAKSISNAELRKRARDGEEQRERDRESERERRIESCAGCVEDRERCRDRGETLWRIVEGSTE